MFKKCVYKLMLLCNCTYTDYKMDLNVQWWTVFAAVRVEGHSVC